jgi:hypothetical protein
MGRYNAFYDEKWSSPRLKTFPNFNYAKCPLIFAHNSKSDHYYAATGAMEFIEVNGPR